MANTFRWVIFSIVLLALFTVVPVSAVTFSGRVYDGPVGDERIPVSGVTLSLYCSNDAGVLGTRIMSTTTDGDGWYGVEGRDGYEFYTIRETVPRGATAVGATTVSGTVESPTTIQYMSPLTRKTLTGNKFWLSTGETPPLPMTCPVDCACMLESVAEAEYDAYEQCGMEICGYDGRTPMYCFHAKDANSLSILRPLMIQHLAYTDHVNRSYDLNNDNSITIEDVRIAVRTIFDERIRNQQSNSCEYPGKSVTGYTEREWERICTWDPDQTAYEIIRSLKLEYPKISLAEAQETAFMNDLNSLQVNYLAGVVNPTNEFLADVFQHSWKFEDTDRTTDIIMDEVKLKSSPRIHRVRDMSFLPKDITSSTYGTDKPGSSTIEGSVSRELIPTQIKSQYKKQIPTNQGILTTSFNLEVIQELDENLEQLKDDLNIPPYLRENYVIEGGYALVEGWDFGTCPTQHPVREGDNIVCTVILNWTVKGEEILDPKLVTQTQYGSEGLLPATGDWKSSWGDYGIGVWIPPLTELDYSTADARLEILKTKYTCEMYMSCPQPGTCLPGGLDCTQEILGAASHPIYIVKDVPTISFVSSNPDYSNWDVLPEGWGQNTMIAGGDVLITGKNFGDKEGTIKVELLHPVEAYSFQEPYDSLPPSSVLSDGTSIPFTITQWSNNAIRLKIGKINANFKGDWAMLSITKKGAVTATPHMFYFSPKWRIVQTSGEMFYNPSKHGDDYYTTEVESNHLIVSHDPACSFWKGKWSGDHGFDDFFMVKQLPPNVRVSQMSFTVINPVTTKDEIKQMIDVAKALYDDFGETWIKMLGTAIIVAFNDNAGSWGAEITKPDVSTTLEYHGALEKDPSVEIEWDNTCLDFTPYKNKDLKYIVTFWVYAPEGVDLGE